MECNKEEAIRVRDIAELNFAKKDLVGAKKFILEALKLYPRLDGAIQLSAVLDIHIAAQVKVGINEPVPDYYGILQVKPLSDKSAITKQYRNLAILVHPDKNRKSMKEEAETAFKLIGEAFGVLSDQKTRSQHDLKRGKEKPTAKETPKPTYSTHQPQPQSREQETPKATYSANQPRYKAAAQPTRATGAQASQASSTSWTPASPATGTQAFQAPYTFLRACPVCRTPYQGRTQFQGCCKMHH